MSQEVTAAWTRRTPARRALRRGTALLLVAQLAGCSGSEAIGPVSDGVIVPGPVQADLSALSSEARGKLAAIDDALDRVLPGIAHDDWRPAFREALLRWRAAMMHARPEPLADARSSWEAMWSRLPSAVRTDPDVEALALVVDAVARGGR